MDSNGEDPIVWLAIIATGLLVAIFLLDLAIRALAGSWYVQAGGVIAILAAPFYFDYLRIEALKDKPLSDLVDGALDNNGITFKVKSSALSHYRSWRNVYDTVTIIIILFVGLKIISANHGHDFKLPFMAAMVFIALVFLARVLVIPKIVSDLETKYGEEILKRLPDETLKLDLSRILRAISTIDTIAKKLSFRPSVNYKSRLSDVLAKYKDEILSNTGKPSVALTKELEALTERVETDSKMLAAADNALATLNARYSELLTEIRRLRSQKLAIALQDAYDPINDWNEYLGPAFANWQWDTLKAQISDINAKLKEVQAKVESRRQQRATGGQQRQRTTNTTYQKKTTLTQEQLDAYDLLKSKPGDTIDEIKKRYRALLFTKHPDEFDDASKAVKDTKNKDTEKLVKAFELLKALLGKKV